MPLYDVGIPPPAEQLGEPSRLFREPTQSYLVQVSFDVKDAGTVDEGTHLFYRWVHFRNVGGGFLLPKIAIANPAKIPKRHQAEPHYHSNIW